MLKLVSPSTKYKEQALEYKKEFIDADDNLAGGGGLRESENFDEWLLHLKKYSDEKTTPSDKVPSQTFLAIREDDDKMVGIIDIRVKLNDYLLKFGGNIGYSIKINERRKGYAKEMLKLALEKSKEFGLKKVLITCDDTNIGSAKTIESNGGVLENKVMNGQTLTRRYWINMI